MLNRQCCNVLHHVLHATELLRRYVACNMYVVSELSCYRHVHDYGSMIIQYALNFKRTTVVFHNAAAHG